MPVSHAVEWSYLLNEERRNERAFFASLKGLKLEKSTYKQNDPGNPDDDLPLADRIRKLMPANAADQSNMDFGYIKVSPEEIARRKAALKGSE